MSLQNLEPASLAFGRLLTARRLQLGVLAAAFGFAGGCGWCSPCRTGPTGDRYPLGAVNRAHYHTMETNGEASDFVLHRNDFVDATAELTPAGKDHLLEIAARARTAPFPVLVERSENNAAPAVDEQRREAIVQVLTKCGVADAPTRTVVAPAYGTGLTGREAESDACQFGSTRSAK